MCPEIYSPDCQRLPFGQERYCCILHSKRFLKGFVLLSRRFPTLIAAVLLHSVFLSLLTAFLFQHSFGLTPQFFSAPQNFVCSLHWSDGHSRQNFFRTRLNQTGFFALLLPKHNLCFFLPRHLNNDYLVKIQHHCNHRLFSSLPRHKQFAFRSLFLKTSFLCSQRHLMLSLLCSDLQPYNTCRICQPLQFHISDICLFLRYQLYYTMCSFSEYTA